MWLRGSQFSLPTFSMQNFWGPLLPMTKTNKNAGHEGRKLVMGFAQVRVCVPIRSAKPPTGRRQVPVTNCSSLILFSLSISLTNWPKVLCKISHRQGNLFTFHVILHKYEATIEKDTFLNGNYPVTRLYLPEPEDLFTASSIVSVNGVSLPVDQVDLLHPTQHYLQARKFFNCVHSARLLFHPWWKACQNH